MTPEQIRDYEYPGVYGNKTTAESNPPYVGGQVHGAMPEREIVVNQLPSADEVGPTYFRYPAGKAFTIPGVETDSPLHLVSIVSTSDGETTVVGRWIDDERGLRPEPLRPDERATLMARAAADDGRLQEGDARWARHTIDIPSGRPVSIDSVEGVTRRHIHDVVFKRNGEARCKSCGALDRKTPSWVLWGVVCGVIVGIATGLWMLWRISR